MIAIYWKHGLRGYIVDQGHINVANMNGNPRTCSSLAELLADEIIDEPVTVKGIREFYFELGPHYISIVNIVTAPQQEIGVYDLRSIIEWFKNRAGV
jgi:hypothetical protein